MSGSAPLTVSLDSTLSTIKIEIGVKTLLHALMAAPEWPMEFVITKKDEAEFVENFIRYGLEGEEEDGTTPIHRMFDQTAQDWLEQGHEGVTEYPDDEEGSRLEKRLVELRAEMGTEP